MQMIQPLTREEVQHRTDMAECFQNSTLIELRKAASIYADDFANPMLSESETDHASAAQCICELGRRGEWQHALSYGLPEYNVTMAKLFADDHFGRLEGMESHWPKSGRVSDRIAAAVWAMRAEMTLRRVEAVTSELVAAVVL